MKMDILKKILTITAILGMVFFCKSYTHAFFGKLSHEITLPAFSYSTNADNTACCDLIANMEGGSHSIKATVPNIFDTFKLNNLLLVIGTVFISGIILLSLSTYSYCIRKKFGSFNAFCSYLRYFRIGLLHPKKF